MMRSESGETNQKIERIRILHLSDFHFPQVKFKDALSIKDGRVNSPHISILDEVYKIIDTVDYILISGDLTSSANVEDFDKCLSFIYERFSHYGAKIYSVVGNHDFERGSGAEKFTRFLQTAQEYPSIDFGGLEICEHRKLIKPLKPELDLLLINTCKNASDKPYIPKKLEEYVKKPILQFLKEKVKETTLQLDDEKATKIIWDEIKENIEKSTLIDEIYLEDDDYKTLANELADIGSLICLSHYNLVSFSGRDELNSFFSDQGRFRDIFVNHKKTVVYLSGHTHTQECTIIEKPEDQTNKLVCITSPPLFDIDTTEVNGFNVIDIIVRMDDYGFYKPIGCEIKQIGNNLMNGIRAERKKIRFSKSFADLTLSEQEGQVLYTLAEMTKQMNKIRLKDLLVSLDSNKHASEKMNKSELHDILIYLWWIGVIEEYSAMNRENVYDEAKLIDYVGGVLCVPIGH